MRKKNSITKGVHASNQHLWQVLQWPPLHHPSFPFPNKSQPYPQSTKVSIVYLSTDRKNSCKTQPI